MLPFALTLVVPADPAVADSTLRGSPSGSESLAMALTVTPPDLFTVALSLLAVGGWLSVFTVTLTLALFVESPRLSKARAERLYVPAAAPLHVNAYGLVVSSPSLVAPL